MLPSVCGLYRKSDCLQPAIDIQASLNRRRAREARVRPPHAVMLCCVRALEPSCPRTLMFSWIHALVLSHCDAFLLSSPRALVKEQLGNAAFYVSCVYCLICSESVAALFSIPRESIRSLSNSLPVLARTGFENRALAEVKRPVLKIKVFVS